jgi:hypothetical protein
MHPAFKILRIFWVLLGVFFFCGSIYLLFTGYSYDGYFWLGISAVCALMYWLNGKRSKVWGRQGPPNPREGQPEVKKKKKK